MQLYESDHITKVEDMRDVHGVGEGHWGGQASPRTHTGAPGMPLEV